MTDLRDTVSLPAYTIEHRVSASQAAEGGVDWSSRTYRVPELWSHSQGAGVTVAIIDTGVCPHIALSQALIESRSFHDHEDCVGHGTHVAGIIAARSGPMLGVAPQSKIMSLKVLGSDGTGSNRSVADALRFCADHSVDIACMSLGSAYPDAEVHAALCYAVDMGVTVICAAGNNYGAVNYPAAYPESIGVSAVDQQGNACIFSSRGAEVSVAAPGYEITSCWLDNGYATLSGTSMAAPFIAGVCAIYISSERMANREPTPADIKRAISESSRDVGAVGKDPVYGWGLIDPHSMIHPPKGIA